MKPDYLTAEEARSLLNYDPETGILRWRVSPNKRIQAGSICGGISIYGYSRLRIKGRYYQSHRIAWLYVYGKFPNGSLDHQNGICTDNRICNLRLATTSENSMNAKRRSDNTSGVKSVSWNKFSQRWLVTIKKDGRAYVNKRFKTFQEAKQAAKTARENLHRQFARHS